VVNSNYVISATLISADKYYINNKKDKL